MQAVVVIRKKTPKTFPENERNLVADILGWNREAVDKTLVGAGWYWLPGNRPTAQAKEMVDRLANLNLQAGLVSEKDAASVRNLICVDNVAVTEEGYDLKGRGHTFKITPETQLSASLVGVRWDGDELRPYLHHAARPCLLFWQKTGPVGVVWISEKAGGEGLSWLEAASFLEQAAAKRVLNFVDDSYRAEDVPRPHKNFLQLWTQAGGAGEDYAILLHCVMLRALDAAGAFDRRGKTSFDVDAPISIYSVRKRGFDLPGWYAIAVLGLAIVALLLIRFAPGHPATLVLGTAAGLAALLHSLYTLGSWLKLRARPISKVRSMAVGRVHLEGSIEPAMELVSPIRGIKCVYYKTIHERRGTGYGSSLSFRSPLRSPYQRSWRTVSKSVAPCVPFYVKDATGKVLIDSQGAEFTGLESYTQYHSSYERVREWVFPASTHANVYGFASAEPDSPAVGALRAGLEVNFLMAAGQSFDLNFDGVISDSERHIARQALEEHLQADDDNATLKTGIHLKETKREPLVVCNKKGFPLGVVRGFEALGFMAAGIGLFLGTFVYPNAFHSFLSVLISSRYFY